MWYVTTVDNQCSANTESRYTYVIYNWPRLAIVAMEDGVHTCI